MSFKVFNHGGVWVVTRDGSGLMFKGGAEISYALFKQLKDAPHEAEEYFKLDKSGRPIEKSPRKAQD